MSVDVVVFVVHGQSSCFGDCIDPYVDSFILNGHRPELMVIDSTDVPAERNAAKESLSRLHRKYRLKVSYSSKREHEKYLASADMPLLRHAVGGGTPEVGALVNMGLLATGGRSALFIDADTRFEMSSPRLVGDEEALPPIVRRFNLIGEMSGESVSRVGTWGRSCTTSNGCFYKSGACNVPPFIPSLGWGQGIQWLLMKSCAPDSLPTDLPLAVRKLSTLDGLCSEFFPLLDMIIDQVGPGGITDAGAKLEEYLDESESEFDPDLISYVNLLSSWDECMDYAQDLHGRGVKIAYKP
jgi:hypothetical protein